MTRPTPYYILDQDDICLGIGLAIFEDYDEYKIIYIQHKLYYYNGITPPILAGNEVYCADWDEYIKSLNPIDDNIQTIELWGDATHRWIYE